MVKKTTYSIDYGCNDIPQVTVNIINHQLGKTPALTSIRGRKKYKFPHRLIRYCREEDGGYEYIKCPFCKTINTDFESDIDRTENCEHVVYGYETVNYLEICANPAFLRVLAKLISSDPSYFIEDLEHMISKYVEMNSDVEGEELDIDLDELLQILQDEISPTVIEKVIEKNGIPIGMKSIIEYSLYDVYIGGGTYMYLVSDDDLAKLKEFE